MRRFKHGEGIFGIPWTKSAKYIAISLCGIVFFLSWFLFFRQYTTYNGLYNSDLPVHLNIVKKDSFGYSLNSLIYKAVYAVLPSFRVLTGVVALMAVAGMVAALFFYVSLSQEKKITAEIVCVTFLMPFLSSLYIPGLFPYFYKNSLSTQAWHNSTSFTMVLFGYFAFRYYLKLETHYMKQISVREWVCFTLLLLLVNYAKPNFMWGFAPMMLCYLIRDFCITKGRAVKQQIIFGTCVLVSLIIFIYQKSRLFPSEGSNKIVFTFRNLDEPGEILFTIISILTSWTFPMIVTMIARVKKIKLPPYMSKAWLFAVWCLFVAKFFVEDGSRAAAGNFGWQTKIGAAILFLSAWAALREYYSEGKVEQDVYRICLGIFELHIITGIAYYCYLLSGGNFHV